MKIGILTFHWGTNYGAVLQAYALQQYLILKGHEVKIINYAPKTFRDSFIKCFFSKNPKVIFNNIIDYIKEQNIKRFRRKYLKQTVRYSTPEELINNPPIMDVYITGSDQVWNPYSLINENCIYFLPFSIKNTIKLAYAASFGVEQYPVEHITDIKFHLRNFSAISVRENSGIKILHDAGITESYLMPDPTLLLEKDYYFQLFDKKDKGKTFDFFFYVLQKKQKVIDKLFYAISKNRNINIAHTGKLYFSTLRVDDWLSLIFQSNFIITNSFHGVIFSIIFHKSFIVVPIEGNKKGMNDRISTLLEKFGLLDRIVTSDDYSRFEIILNSQINWTIIDKIKKSLLIDANSFFSKYIE